MKKREGEKEQEGINFMARIEFNHRKFANTEKLRVEEFIFSFIATVHFHFFRRCI